MRLLHLSFFFSFIVGVSVFGLFSQIMASADAPSIRRAPGVRPHRMSKWVVHAGRLETQGLVGDASGSVAEQTKQIFEKLDAILEEAGARREDLIHVDVWLKDIESDFDAMNAVYDEYMAAIPLATEEAIVGAEYGDASSGGGDGAGASRFGSLTTRQLPTRVCVGAALSGGFAVELRATAACCTADKGAILYTRARL